MLSAQEQLKIIAKGVQTLINPEELLAKLEENRPLTIKLGLDPSAPDIHLGHAVVLRKIKQMQDLGHRVVIVIGDFTGKIGDPTGKAKGRKALTDREVRENAQTYFEQIFRVLDREKTEVRYNGEWLARLNFEEVLRLAATTTVARILERDDFQSRFQAGTPIGLHEFFYPLMQAYDSVELQADIELGGTDQTFNILMGRTLQKSVGQPQQACLFMPLLEGLDGVEKMSKSLGNYIGVYEPAEVMFKKVMEVPDRLIAKYYELATDEHPDRVAEIRRALDEGANPRDVKYGLAKAITALYHAPEAVESAMRYYDAAFANKDIPDEIPELPVALGAALEDCIPLLVEAGFVKSRSEFLRLLRQNGVRLDGEKLTEEQLGDAVANGPVLRLGKKAFVRLIPGSDRA